MGSGCARRCGRPRDTEVTIPSNAFTIHQAISQLRSGTVDGVRYGKVVIVGHSLGSLISWYEAGTYHDVDAVIASGILHSFEPVGTTQFVTTLFRSTGTLMSRVTPKTSGDAAPEHNPGDIAQESLVTGRTTPGSSCWNTPNASSAVAVSLSRSSVSTTAGSVLGR